MSETSLVEYDKTREQHVGLAQEASRLFGVIDRDDQYTGAGEFLIRIKTARRVWASLVKPVIQAAYEAHRKTIALQKEVDNPLARAENEIIKPAMVKYSQAKEAAIRAEEKRINAKLRAEAEARAKEEREVADAKAILNAQGKPVTAEPPAPSEITQPTIVPQVVLPRQEEPEGISYFDVYVAEVTDLMELAKAVVQGIVPPDAIKANQPFINGRVHILKEHMKWPGVTVNKVSNVRANTRGTP